MIDLPLINKVLVLLIDLIGFWLSLLVYRQNPKGKLNKIFVFMVVLMFLWVNFAYFARTIGQDQIDLAELFLKIAWFVTPLFFTFLYFLVIHLLKEEKEYLLLNKIVLFAGGSAALVVGFTNFIIKGIEFVNGDLAIIYGIGMWFFLGVGFFLISATLYPLIKAYLKFSYERREKIEYFLIGILIFYLGNTIFNIVLPSMFGIVRFYYLGDYSAIFLLGFTAYAIVKRELFGIKIVLTTLLVSLIAILLLFDIFILTQEPLTQLFKGLLLIIFLYFGYLLIKSVLREIALRAELQKTYKELEKLDKAKSEFISIASHQLRTPLTAIKGYISLIREEIYGEIPTKMRRALRNVYISSERLIKLVNDLLNISRIEAGRIKAERTPLYLGDVIDSVVEELKNMAKKKGLYLRWEKSKKKLPKISLDREKIRQVILNFIDNGIRYTEEGGVTIKYEKVDGKYRVAVIDTGPGMTKKDISQLFKTFTRGSIGQRTWTGGAGLGLYIAKKFVEMHNGEVWAESKGEGKGSTFYMEVPIK
ncbi:MAG: ATP-binding protein [Patescibacteria group bacterium]|nr:ATP-binding protein [Patescibacteria group bacterium]